MKNGRFSDAQIMGILKQAACGVPVSDLCCEHGMSSASFYKWRARFGGVDASMVSQMKAMAEENRRLKRMYGEMSMQNEPPLVYRRLQSKQGWSLWGKVTEQIDFRLKCAPERFG